MQRSPIDPWFSSSKQNYIILFSQEVGIFCRNTITNASQSAFRYFYYLVENSRKYFVNLENTLQNSRVLFNWIKSIQQKLSQKIHLQSKGDSKNSFILDTKWKGCLSVPIVAERRLEIHNYKEIHNAHFENSQENCSSQLFSKICKCYR